MAWGANGLRKIEFFHKKPERGIHSEMHALAKEVSEYCGEPKKFAMYLGVIKNVGLPRAYKIFSEIKQGKDIKTPGKLFLYLSAKADGQSPKKQVLKIIKSGNQNKKLRSNQLKKQKRKDENSKRTKQNTA